MQDDRLSCEVGRLKAELLAANDPSKEVALLGAIQALEWALSPEIAVAPTWACLAGKVQPLTGIQAS